MQVIGNTNLCKMGNTSEFKRDLLGILNLIGDSETDSNTLDEVFDQSVESLFPLFLIKDGILYHNPPALVQYILLHYRQALDNREILMQITAIKKIFPHLEVRLV